MKNHIFLQYIFNITEKDYPYCTEISEYLE
jgi:hypothetical protein